MAEGRVSSVTGAKRKGQLTFPRGFVEDYRKEFRIVTGPSRSLHKDNI